MSILVVQFRPKKLPCFSFPIAKSSPLCFTSSLSLADPLVGQTTLDSRLRFDPSSASAYSPHHQMTLTASSHRLTGANKGLTGSPCRSPATTNDSGGGSSGYKHMTGSTLPSYTSQQQQQTARLLGEHGDGFSTATSALAGARLNGNLHQSLVRRSSPNSSSQYSGQQWRMKKDNLGQKCSWKFTAILFMLLSVILISALIYMTGKKSN